MSDSKNLVRMANQIADFFAGYPEEEAVPGIAGHIRNFWTPDMREKLSQHVASGGSGLKPLALKALSSMAFAAGDA